MEECVLMCTAICSFQHSNESSTSMKDRRFVISCTIIRIGKQVRVTLLRKLALHRSGAMFQCLCLNLGHPISLSPLSPFPMSSTTSDGVLLVCWRLLLLRLLPLSSPSSSRTQALSTVSMKVKSCCTLGSRNSEASRLSPKCTVLLRRRRRALDTTWKGRRPYRGRVEDDSTIAPRRRHQSMFLMLQCKAHSVFILMSFPQKTN